MKKIAIVLIAIAIVTSAAMAGDMAKSGQWGIQTSLGVTNNTFTGLVNAASGNLVATQTIGLKFMASENLAVRIEAGFNSYSPGGGGASSSGYGFGAGFEYHMTAVGGVSPYVGLGAGYSGWSFGGAANNPSVFAVNGFWGGEYFFSSNFSWGGQIGIGFASLSPGGGGNSQTSIGTTGASTSLTWYLN